MLINIRPALNNISQNTHNALKVSEKPIVNSQGNAMQASAPLRSMERGIIASPLRNQWQNEDERHSITVFVAIRQDNHNELHLPMSRAPAEIR